ncbi:MAG: SIR2 family protein, partial [Pseudanabaena sp. M135S2SP2A07QC]|nr:SIR2 family protein [Pseudanabaena sp. M176S2SP2A07QC]MCA6541565.1 SIR2 family protein [Pseudanabaena sp. M037S2SP2A07QC]MCA6550375.1 SIR2 family protein [Pseudanabaena sp. M152S2SP2A07QC]MCA6552093.1 SIR2 family protein [Pseudanabaena sp. M135S2SP2A07QC]MCA6565551.1 SIR2 family protein [Pseudanabaena sp. M151S2SP2A07QC]MCA6568852.1 SIR2 family protein [Pseudanabaena sp. M065S1SP2A07QC]
MELPEIVVSSIRTGQVVLFLGTRALLGYQIKGQISPEDTLRNELSDRFLDGQYNQESLQWVTELAVSAYDLGTVQDFIASKFRRIQPEASHLILPTFRWKGIATTSFDRLLETAYDSSRNRVQELIPIISNHDRIDEKLQSNKSLALLKLHGCITRTQDPKLPLILSTDQYSTHKESRDRLFKTFYEWCYESTVIFIGGGSQDSELRSVLLQVLNEVKNRPPYYLVQPKVSGAEKNLWESKRITVLEGKFDDFIRSLDKSIKKELRPLAQGLQLPNHPIERKFVKNEPIVGSLKDLLTHDVEYVHDAIVTVESDPKQFYKGFNLEWYPIIRGFDVRRRLTDTVLYDVILRPDSDRPTLSELYVIKSEAGSGKTIFLRRLAWESATQANVICLFMKTASNINFEAIRELYRLANERIFVFVDAAADNIYLILLLLEEARRFEVPLTIITAARANEWNMSCDRLADYVTKDYQLRYLSEVEILDLVNLLEKHDALGPNLKNKNLNQRVQEFGEKAGRQLLVALHEATLGRPFREIIVDEYQHIYPKQAQDLYLTVCFLNRLGAPVRVGLIARVHDISFHDFREKLFVPLEHVVQTEQKSSSDVYYLARHPQIAQIVFEDILLDEHTRYNEYIRVLRYLNIAYDSDRDSFRKLVKAKDLSQIFSSHEDVKAIYEMAREYVGADAYLYQQMANYERITNGDYQLAEEYLRVAQESDPRDRSIVHSQAELAADRGRKAEHPLERQKFRNQAFSFLKDLIKSSKSESDQYARTTYLKLAIDNLRYVLEQDEPTNRDIEDAVRDIEKILEETKQNYPENTFVNNLEAEFANLIEDDERALKALEIAFNANPRDSYIAIRLSTLYKNKDNLESASSCLKKALENQTLSKELNYQYAQVLRKMFPRDIDSLIYYFGRAFSKGDQNYPAQFWYSRYLFESSDLEKINESKSLFQRLRYGAIQYEVRRKVRDYIIPNHKREATDRASSIESLPTREAMTDLVISERRFLTKSLNSSIFLG